jgi:SAM-dependent methyltransferase
MSRPRPAAEAERRFRAYQGRLAGKPLTEVFTTILRENVWGSAETPSGLGSELEATAAVRHALPDLMRRHGVRSVLDIPCGDGRWMAELALDGYVGADIVAELIERNRQLSPGRRFEVLDLTKDPLPRVDLVFCRDCLVHLSYINIGSAIANLQASGSRLLLATTFPGRGGNVDIADGDWRPLDFQDDPFRWPEPLELLNEHCREEGGAYLDKSLGLWRISDLPTAPPPVPAPTP